MPPRAWEQPRGGRGVRLGRIHPRLGLGGRPPGLARVSPRGGRPGSGSGLAPWQKRRQSWGALCAVPLASWAPTGPILSDS